MNRPHLNDDDYALIQAAQAEFTKVFAHHGHGVASALRLKSGKFIADLCRGRSPRTNCSR